MSLQLQIFNPRDFEFDATTVQALAERIWSAEGKNDAQINIVLVDDAYIRKLNKTFFGKDYATDVIAFQISENENPFEGEIYIGVDTVSANAASYQVEVQEELRRVVAHGLLHFVGYRDNTEAQKQRMREREDFYLTEVQTNSR